MAGTEEYTQKNRVWLLTGFAVLFTLALGVRLHEVFSLTTMTHDGSISYAAAAGKQDDLAVVFTGTGPYAQWVPASEWKQFITADQPFNFAAISESLAETDIHPPFYFWLLHIYMLIFGTHAWTGPLLNTCLAVGTALAVYLLARVSFNGHFYALGASLLWFACTPALMASLVARQYDLLTLLAVLLIWRVVLITKPDHPLTWKDKTWLTVLCTIGPLTHLHFGLVMLGCGFYLLLALPRIRFRKPFTALAFMALGVVLFVGVHPQIFESIARGRQQLQPFTWEAYQTRQATIWQMLGQYWGVEIPLNMIVRALVLLAFGLFGLILLRRLRPGLLSKIPAREEEFPVIFFFLWNLGFIILLYLTFMAPGHAMGNRYLSLVWPFLAGLCVVVIRYFPAQHIPAILTLATGLVLASGLVEHPNERITLDHVDPVPVIQKADAVLIDNPARGYLLQYVYVIPADKPMYAAYQNSIIQNPDSLMSRTFQTMAYHNLNAYGNTLEMHKEVVDILQEAYYLQRKRKVAWSFGQMYLCVRRFQN